MYEFVLFSRKGQTDNDFSTLLEAGRLDTVYQCILTAIFKSHGHRKDVTFHAILEGPPKPPLHLEVSGESLYDVRVDEQTWTTILRKILSGGEHPGIDLKKGSFENLIKTKKDDGYNIYVLEEKGKKITEVDFGDKALFILGDHIGLPKNKESFALRFGEKISLGKQKYLALSCIDIVNFVLDNYVGIKMGRKR